MRSDKMYLVKHSIIRGFCTSCVIMNLFYFSPLTLNPFPPKGAREVIAPQSLPALFGGRMSEG
jgi:hypothetical protein